VFENEVVGKVFFKFVYGKNKLENKPKETGKAGEDIGARMGIAGDFTGGKRKGGGKT